MYRYAPQGVKVDYPRAVLVIDWNDGHHSEYPFRYLREHCPCAACVKDRSQNTPKILLDVAFRLDGIAPVGNYALNLIWGDGHAHGIYNWDYLREICPCPECTAARQQRQAAAASEEGA